MRLMIAPATLVLAASLLLAACGGAPGTQAQGKQNANQPTSSVETSKDFDAAAYYHGQWRGSVETSGTTVYGSMNGSEPMLDVFINEDGTCEVAPLEAHADLPAGTGTWEASDDTAATLKLPNGDVVLKTVDKSTLEGDSADFGIEGFDVITFVLY